MSRRSSGGILAAIVLVVLLAWPWSSAAADENAKRPLAEPANESKAAEKDPFDGARRHDRGVAKYIDGLNKIQPSSSLRPAVAELHQEACRVAIEGLQNLPCYSFSEYVLLSSRISRRFQRGRARVRRRLATA